MNSGSDFSKEDILRFHISIGLDRFSIKDKGFNLKFDDGDTVRDNRGIGPRKRAYANSRSPEEQKIGIDIAKSVVEDVYTALLSGNKITP